MSDIGARLAQAQRLLALGKAKQAESELRRALQHAPGSPELNNAMSLVLMSMGQGEQGVYFAQRAAAARPGDPVLLVNLGMALGAMNRADEAHGPLSRAVELAPEMAAARHGLANVLWQRGDFTGTAEHTRAGLATAPEDPGLAAMHASALTSLARVSEAAAFARGWLSRRADLRVAGVYANLMLYCAEAEPAEVTAAQAAFGRMLEGAAGAGPVGHTNDPDPGRVLHIGVVSHELRRHAVATFLEPWLEHRDRRGMHLTCYATAANEDEVTARMKKCADAWVNARAIPDAALAQRVRGDRIDILLETSGNTQGHRLGVMALKPAPLQGSMIGYLSTTGVRAIDFRIVDGPTDPLGTESLSVERLVRLEPTCWCYRADESAPAPIDVRDGPVVFGSFNAATKINERLVSLWTRVLKATPGSRLLLKAFEFADERLRADVAARFEREGLEPGRVEVEGPTHGMGAFLANYNRVDVGLDPLPFNGTTTTLDALWMGVPVVTLAGRIHAGRTGVSILSTLEMPELIAAGEDEYVRIATDLGADRARLNALRRTLRTKVAGSALRDGPGFAARMDAALRGLWREWCAGRRGGGAGR